MQIDLPSNIDKKILPAVKVLNEHGSKTFESCEGGEPHAFIVPTVRFEGSEFDLIRAYEICQLYHLPVDEVRRVYRKTSIYKDEKNLLGETWKSPFNEITL